jgi:hypothetical protein
VLRDESAWYEKASSKNSISQAMDGYVTLYGAYSMMLAVDLEGRVVAASSVDAKGRAVNTAVLWDRNFRGEPWFQNAVSGRFTTSMPHARPENTTASGTFVTDAYFAEELKLAHPSSDGFTVGFAAPFKGHDGRVAGVWVNYLDMDTLSAVVRSSLTTEDGASGSVLAVLDGAGKPVAYFENGAKPANFAPMVTPTVDLGASVVRDVLAGKDAHGVTLTSDKRKTLLVGAAHSRGAMGYPGTNW